SSHYQRLLESNKVHAIPLDTCHLGEAFDFDRYGILGFPEELFDRRRQIDAAGFTVIGGVRPVLLMGKRVEAVPREKPMPTTPWFAVELADKGDLNSMVGMSGGPILGFLHRPGQPDLYTIVAVQGWWDKERGIAFGTSLTRVLNALNTIREQAI